MSPIRKDLYRYNNATAQILAGFRGGKSYYPGASGIIASHPGVVERINQLAQQITPDLSEAEVEGLRERQFALMDEIAQAYGGFDAFLKQIKA